MQLPPSAQGRVAATDHWSAKFFAAYMSSFMRIVGHGGVSGHPRVMTSAAEQSYLQGLRLALN
jgi:hypothetical protein